MAGVDGEVIPVRVALRIRPISKKEIESGCDQVLDVVPGRSQIYIKNSQKAFTYDYAYSTDSEQDSIYDKSVQPLVDKLFKGYNATVLAYGQTGSGKTYTMGTTNEIPEGVIPRAVRDIFHRIKNLEQQYEFSVRVAFVELYQEKLYDLLNTKSKNKEDCIVDLRENGDKGVIIANLKEVPVETLDATMDQLNKGSIKRVTASTAMNNVSSRSHAIFTLFIEGTLKTEPTGEEENEMANIFVKFHLVDLAGSERAKKTEAKGERFKEGVKINLGLLSLGNVISALGDDNGAKSHIPYRDSKLTRLLQDSLGGNSHTLMIACVSPADTNLEETISTLRYADRARKIKNKPIVNQDGKDAEIAKLKREVAELRLRGASGGSGSASSSSNVNSKEFEDLKTKYSQQVTENRELASALMSCQDELSHMNEKLLLTEDAGIKLTTKCKELAAFTEPLINKTPTKLDMESVFKKITDLVDMQKDNEKSLIDHDRSRFQDSTLSSSYDTASNSLNMTTEEYGTTEILKQNALASQLAALNKQLAQKEQYAENLTDQEEKLRQIRIDYEVKLQDMETQMKTLEKEKGELVQKNRNEPASSKIAEQRRRRIQELEASMGDLRKKLIEQQRMIKMNEKNEQKLKQAQEEIRGMKNSKVRLIRQMREEAEKVRMWKMKKEKEVNQLKQSERKQQVQITKMSNLHSKQQNVIRRKMEEALAAKKRLEDVIAKQKAAKKGTGKQGLAGAAERMRNLVSQELDVVVSVKEAKQSREQLIKDRTVMGKELAELKRKQRVTMTNTEREQMSKRISELEDEMKLRNTQISDLQNQLMDLDTNENDNNQQNVMGSAKWWDSLSTMTEAKIALQYLFEKAAENMATLSNSKTQNKDLKSQYDEAIKTIEGLEDEVSNLKDEHEDKMVEAGKDYEERVAFLLKQLTNKTLANTSNPGASGTGNDLVDTVKDADIQKFSMIQKALQEMKQEAETNKKVKKENDLKRRETKVEERYTMEEFFNERFSDSDESEEDDDESEAEWGQTPLIRRIKKIRENTLTSKVSNKRKLGETFDANGAGAANDENQPKPKRSTSMAGLACSCKTGCKTKRCSCYKGSKGCSDLCKCPSELCSNKGQPSQANSSASSADEEERVVLGDKTNNISANSTACNTMSLLNDTYQVVEEVETSGPSRKLTAPIMPPPISDQENAPKKARMSMFKSPIATSDSTQSPQPSSTLVVPSALPRQSMFKSPLNSPTKLLTPRTPATTLRSSPTKTPKYLTLPSNMDDSLDE